MAKFTPIDMNTWGRRELFKLYTDAWGAVQWSFTKKIDISKLYSKAKERKLKITACIMYVVNTALNRQMNWKIRFVNGELGYYDEICPSFPVLSKDGNFTYHTIDYHKDFNEFYKEYLEDQVKYPNDQVYPFAHTVTPPANNFIISIMNFVSFDADSIILKYPKNYYSPIVIIGKFEEVDGKKLLPISISMNHAVADGYHLGVLFDDIGKIIEEF